MIITRLKKASRLLLGLQYKRAHRAPGVDIFKGCKCSEFIFTFHRRQKERDGLQIQRIRNVSDRIGSRSEMLGSPILHSGHSISEANPDLAIAILLARFLFRQNSVSRVLGALCINSTQMNVSTRTHYRTFNYYSVRLGLFSGPVGFDQFLHRFNGFGCFFVVEIFKSLLSLDLIISVLREMKNLTFE